MRKLIYSMGVSLDGYIVGADGKFDWAAPDEELHRFHNAQAREVGMHLYGRRLYETMRFWEDVGDDDDEPTMAEFARIWKAGPKLVFSTTLDAVHGPNIELADGDAVEIVKRLKEQDGGPLAAGGAGLAATLIRAGLVDEYGLFVNPVLAGGGTPFFPTLEARADLTLAETRTFGSKVVYVRYVAN
jgi:dihydrofolate reductase